MAVTKVPKDGDRAAKDVLNFPSLHATDLAADTPVHHLPAGEVTGDTPVWDGSKWVLNGASPAGPKWAYFKKPGTVNVDIPASSTLGWVDLSEAIDNTDSVASWGSVPGDDFEYLFLNEASWYEVKIDIHIIGTEEGMTYTAQQDIVVELFSFGHIGNGASHRKVFLTGENFVDYWVQLFIVDYFYPPNDGYWNEVGVSVFNNGDFDIAVSDAIIFVRQIPGGTSPV